MFSLVTILCASVLLAADGAILSRNRRLNGANPLRARQTRPVTVPLSVVGSPSTNILWTFDATVGGQPFNFTIDANAIRATLLDVSYVNKGRDCSEVFANPRRLFNSSLSKSVYVSGPDSSDYEYNWYFKKTCQLETTKDVWDSFIGQRATDTFQIGGITTPNVRFVLTQQTLNPLNECWRSDGVFALSWDQWNENWRDSPPGTILKGFDEQELTLLFGGDPTPNGAPADGGWMTFGGKDPDHCDDKWTWLQQGFAIARWDNAFHVTVKELIWSGAVIQLVRQEMTFRTDTPWITVPADVLDSFAKAVKAEYDFELDVYTVDCDKRATLPKMSWDVGYEKTTWNYVHLYNYDIPAADYARPDPRNPKKCIIYVKGSTNGLRDWELGTTFARSHCINIDYYGSGAVSVALRK